jgi:hypothetical protein
MSGTGHSRLPVEEFGLCFSANSTGVRVTGAAGTGLEAGLHRHLEAADLVVPTDHVAAVLHQESLSLGLVDLSRRGGVGKVLTNPLGGALEAARNVNRGRRCDCADGVVAILRPLC